MRRKITIVCALAVMLVSGCTKSTIVNSEQPAEPVFETQEGIVLDWTQIGEDLDENFLDNEEYPMAVSINYFVRPEDNALDLTLMVKDTATAEEAVEFADAVIRYINDEAATQDFSYERSTPNSYGGFFKEYSINLIVMPDGAMETKESWLVDMKIPAGSEERIVPVT